MNRRDVALILLFNEQGQFLLQHRCNKAPAYPEHWGFFGGGIDEGEHFVDGAARECFEEIEYRLSAKTPILTTFYRNHELNRFGDIYYFAEQLDTQQTLVLHEGQAMGWKTLEDVKRLDKISPEVQDHLAELVMRWKLG